RLEVAPDRKRQSILARLVVGYLRCMRRHLGARGAGHPLSRVRRLGRIAGRGSSQPRRRILCRELSAASECPGEAEGTQSRANRPWRRKCEVCAATWCENMVPEWLSGRTR